MVLRNLAFVLSALASTNHRTPQTGISTHSVGSTTFVPTRSFRAHIPEMEKKESMGPRMEDTRAVAHPEMDYFHDTVYTLDYFLPSGAHLQSSTEVDDELVQCTLESVEEDLDEGRAIFGGIRVYLSHNAEFFAKHQAAYNERILRKNIRVTNFATQGCQPEWGYQTTAEAYGMEKKDQVDDATFSLTEMKMPNFGFDFGISTHVTEADFTLPAHEDDLRIFYVKLPDANSDGVRCQYSFAKGEVTYTSKKNEVHLKKENLNHQCPPRVTFFPASKLDALRL